MHHVENAFLTNYLFNNFLAPIRFSRQIVVFIVIYISVARKDDDY